MLHINVKDNLYSAIKTYEATEVIWTTIEETQCDAFVHGMADLPKTRPSPYVLPRRI